MDLVLEEFSFDILPKGCTFIVIGDSKYRIQFIENLFYYKKHEYPVSKSFVSSEAVYERMCKFTHPLFVNYWYSESEEASYITRQKLCGHENSYPQGPSLYSINVIDGDVKPAKSRLLVCLFKLLSQHLQYILIFGAEELPDFRIEILKSVRFVVLFEENNKEKRKLLYKQLIGSFCPFATFCELMDSIKGTSECLIFSKRDKLMFWYNPISLPEWNFGCNEYRQWGDKYYCPEHDENKYGTKNKWILVKEVLQKHLCRDLVSYLLETFVVGLCWKDS